MTNPRWRFVGRPCLDLAMTGGRGDWARYERLNEPSDLRDWFAQGPLRLPDVDVDDAGLLAAGDLRDAVQHIAFDLLAGRAPATAPVSAVNAFAAAPPLARALDAETLQLAVTLPVPVASALSELARDALDLAADPQARRRVRQCESPDCELLFFDDSRPGNRRWCSQGRCGDRARARAYRARRADR